MFREDFIWGSATSSAQIEGGYNAYDRGESIWDTCSRFRSRNYIANRHTTFDTCNHYGNYIEDVKIMKEIGLKAYRFSISWSRLIPTGDGEVSKYGLQFYNNLIDELKKNDIEPFVTLYHWDFPEALQQRGGWQNSDSVKWFEKYAKVVAENFSDRVKYFITINEPEVFVDHGFIDGTHAPFIKMPPEYAFYVAHNVLKANGVATIAMRENAKQKIYIGQAHCQEACIPYTDSLADLNAAKEMKFNTPDLEFWGSWFLDAINKGEYTESKLKNFGNSIKFDINDMELINQIPDFIGFNTYSAMRVRCGENGKPEYVPYTENDCFSAMHWGIMKDSLYYDAKFLYERYKLPLFVTENGVALTDVVEQDGSINDTGRIMFIKQYLQGLDRAINEGADVRGYFYWSLFDNFEWSHGFSKRFGLVKVDFETFKRTMKKSAYFYKDVIKSNGLNIF